MGTIPHGIYNNNGHGRGRRVDLYLPARFSFFYIFSIAALLRSSFLSSFFPSPLRSSSRSRVSVAGARELDPKSSDGLSTVRSFVRSFVPLRFHTPWRILTLAICTEITTPRALSLSRFLRFFLSLAFLSRLSSSLSSLSILLFLFFLFFLFFLCFFSGDSVVNGDIRGAARTTVHLFTTVSIRWINQSM